MLIPDPTPDKLSRLGITTLLVNAGQFIFVTIYLLIIFARTSPSGSGNTLDLVLNWPTTIGFLLSVVNLYCLILIIKKRRAHHSTERIPLIVSLSSLALLPITGFLALGFLAFNLPVVG